MAVFVEDGCVWSGENGRHGVGIFEYGGSCYGFMVIVALGAMNSMEGSIAGLYLRWIATGVSEA